MLPNRMQLSKTVEEQLKRLKTQTGVTPNISARFAFFKSIESGYRYEASVDSKTDGSLVLDKATWLGKTQTLTELLLRQRYPSFNSKQLQKAWAAHVEHGVSGLRNFKDIVGMMKSLVDNQ